MRIADVWFGFILAAAVAPSPALAKDLFNQDRWKLAIKNDPFTGQTTCKLFSTHHRMRFQPGTIGFFVGRRHDTLAAWYRVDGGAPVRWHDRSAVLIAADVKIDSPSLDNVTDGLVWIPVDEVQHAGLVDIRAGDKARVRHFRVEGFTAAREAATRLGCVSDDAFRL